MYKATTINIPTLLYDSGCITDNVGHVAKHHLISLQLFYPTKNVGQTSFNTGCEAYTGICTNIVEPTKMLKLKQR